MKKALFFFLLFLAPFVYGDTFCSIDNSSSCDTKSGKLELGPIETNAFISQAEDKVCIYYFYSPTCTHCRNIQPFINEIFSEYDREILVTKLDVTEPENIKIYNKLCNLRNYEGGKIPLVGINDRLLVGEDQIRKNLEEEIKRGMQMEENICPLGKDYCPHSPGGNLTTINDSEGLIPKLGKLDWNSVVPVVVIAGLSDGINPCAFVILVFVMAFLQSITSSRRKLLKVTLTYIVSILITNIVLGILYFLVSVRIGYPELIRNGVVVVAVVAGLINIKDFFWYGKGISLGIPKSTKRYLQSLIQKASVPASLVLGVTVAVLEAPCSVPIYLAVIELLKSSGSTLIEVFPYVLLYNIMFIIPLLFISLAVYMGYRAKYLEERSLKAKRYMKLVIGLMLLILAIVLYLGVI